MNGDVDIIERVSTFAAMHFGIDSRNIYDTHRTHICSITRHTIWYVLHCDYGISIGRLANRFLRTRRNIFIGIAKMRNGIRTQRYYADIYTDFVAGLREYMDGKKQMEKE